MDADAAQYWLDKGIEHSQAGRHADAERAFLRALGLNPALSAARLALGLSYMAMRRFSDALPPLRLAVADPDAPGTWHACLAQGLFMTGDFAASDAVFSQAARLEPLGENARLTQIHARCLTAIADGFVDQGLSDYRSSTHADSAGLARFAEEAVSILSGFDRTGAAMAVVRWQLARAPADPVLLYRLKALAGDRLDRSPDEYIEAHFDAFAERFDRQLVDMLKYAVPTELTTLIATHRDRFTHALDLGCGTGLAAEPLSLFNAELTGVDLSGEMLARAAKRGAYQHLVRAEAVQFLATHTNGFDLIFAADVLIYFGDLSALFDGAAAALTAGGCFAFSTEQGESDWALLGSGRFAHADAYIDRQAAQAFDLKARARTILRLEGNREVAGTLHVFQKKAV